MSLWQIGHVRSGNNADFISFRSVSLSRGCSVKLSLALPAEFSHAPSQHRVPRLLLFQRLASRRLSDSIRSFIIHSLNRITSFCMCLYVCVYYVCVCVCLKYITASLMTISMVHCCLFWCPSPSNFRSLCLSRYLFLYWCVSMVHLLSRSVSLVQCGYQSVCLSVDTGKRIRTDIEPWCSLPKCFFTRLSHNSFWPAAAILFFRFRAILSVDLMQSFGKSRHQYWA